MTTIKRAAAWAAVILLASCGGGGGGSPAGGTTGGATPQAVAITETNAKPVSANALDAASNTSAAGSSSLVTGVEIQAGAASQGNIVMIADAASALVSLASPQVTPGLPAAVAVSRTVACALGGTLSASGTIASQAGISAGDSLTITANSCRMNVGAQASTLNGTLGVTIVSGTVSSFAPFHVVMQMTFSNLSTATAASTVVNTGDVRLDLNAGTSSTTITASGSTLAATTTIAGTPHTITLRNYAQSVTVTGNTLTTTLSAQVETDSTRLGTTGATYTISTPTPVTINLATQTATAGAVRVVGASNSQLLLTVQPGGVVSIQIDANGDGTFEKTLSSTLTELRSLL